MYPIVSCVSFIIRFLICWGTIEKYPVFANETLGWIIGQILSIYTILKLICYIITWNVAPKFWVKSPTWKSIIYFIIYLPLIAITYWILRLLTKFHILPF